MDDPIVYPGKPGSSHEHVFFGNRTTDAFSTYASLVGQPTSCRISADHAAYWIPALYVNGTEVQPRFANAYYLAAGARAHIMPFPDCWNGHDLDSADHKSHLAFRVRGICPAGYPVALPRLSFNVHYRLTSLTGLSLASGSIYSAHADFFNAWDQNVLSTLVVR